VIAFTLLISPLLATVFAVSLFTLSGYPINYIVTITPILVLSIGELVDVFYVKPEAVDLFGFRKKTAGEFRASG
jgi:hypothetical protein